MGEQNVETKIRRPASAPNEPLANLTRKILGRTEVLENAESPSLREFYDLLEQRSKFDKPEPFDVFREGLRRNGNPRIAAHAICVVVRDPADEGRIISGALGAVQGGVLAIRFTLSALAANPLRANHEAELALFEKAHHYSSARGVSLWATVGECDGISESYWNHLFDMRRVYLRDPVQSLWKEANYERLAAHDPASTKSRTASKTQRHLHINCSEEMLSANGMRNILLPLWSDHGGSGTNVIELMDKRIVEQFHHNAFALFSKAEREHAEERGARFESLRTDLIL
jgi:hypothetical protein